MEPSCVYPTYKLAPSHDGILNIIHVISNDEADHVPEVYKKKFMNDGKVTVHKELEETHYVNVEKSSKFPITSNSFVKFSNAVSQLPDYQGYASDILTNAYKFARKEKPKAHITVACDENTKDFNSILKLVEGKNRSKELANCRGD